MDSARPHSITDAQQAAFYAGAVAGLRALDARERTPRRFGVDADARWSSFRGALTEADRIDVLVRDAAVTWGAAFSPAEVFGLFGLAPDEPFGPDWQTLSSTTAKRLLAPGASPHGPSEMARALGIPLTTIPVPPLTASTRVAVAGGSAMVAVALAFLGQSGLSWSDQVLAVATNPAHRQLAGLLAVVVESAGKTRLVRPGREVRPTLDSVGFAQTDVAVASPDAEPECAAFARRAAGAV